MNESAQPDVAQAPEQPASQAIVARSRGRRRSGRPRRPAPMSVQTVEGRLEQTKRRAAQLAKEQNIRIPIRLGVPLEMHEALVAIGESIGGVKVANVAMRALELGIDRWSRELRIKVNAKVDPLGVFERNRHVANAHRQYGADEEHVREDLREEADKMAAQRKEELEQLHIPGRRRAIAS